MKRSRRIGVSSRRPWARDEAVESYLPLVKSLVARLRVAYGLRTPFDDLVAAGVVVFSKPRSASNPIAAWHSRPSLTVE